MKGAHFTQQIQHNKIPFHSSTMNRSSILRIQNNHRSGAARITSDCLSALISFIQSDSSSSAEDLFRNLCDYSSQLINAQPFMASIRNETKTFLRIAEEYSNRKITVDEFRSVILKWLTRRIRERRSALHRLGVIGSSVIETNNTILTYSASSAVFSLLTEAHQQRKPFSVIMSEARPMKEGVLFAKRLARCGIPATITIDILLPHYLLAAQKVIIGADWISETQFTNKIGTGLIVNFALKQHIPVYVAASSDKLHPQREYPLMVDEQPPEEIVSNKIPNLTVKNRYFEAVPHSDKLLFITERSILKPEEIIHYITR